MAVTISTFTIASDFLSTNLVIDAGAGNHFHNLYMYLGDGYLTDTYVDLSDMLTGVQTEILEITNEDLGLTATDELIGIFTIYAVASDTATNHRAVVNLYYINLCLANMIVNQEVQAGFNEVSTIYFLLKAITTYLITNVTNQNIEASLNAYERAVAMCEKNPSYLVDEDTSVESGSGDWIINGTYIIE